MPPVKWLNNSLPPKKRQSHLTHQNNRKLSHSHGLLEGTKPISGQVQGLQLWQLIKGTHTPNSAGCWPQTVANGSGQLVGGFRNTGRDEMGQNHSKAWYTAKHPKPKPWQIPTPFWAGYYWCIVWVKIGCPNMWPFCTKHEKKPSSPAPQILMDIDTNNHNKKVSWQHTRMIIEPSNIRVQPPDFSHHSTWLHHWRYWT